MAHEDKLEQFKEAMRAKKEERMKEEQEESSQKSSELEAALAKTQAELKDAKEQYVRLYAEFENFRKRVQKEKEENLRFGHERVIKELLPILDNLEKALDHAKTDADKESLVKGVELVLKQLLSALEAFGLKPVRSVGQPFDPHHHEAMAHEESEEHEPHTVVQEYRRGYKLHDRLIRPSLVTVAKPPNEKNQNSSKSSDEEE